MYRYSTRRVELFYFTTVLTYLSTKVSVWTLGPIQVELMLTFARAVSPLS